MEKTLKFLETLFGKAQLPHLPQPYSGYLVTALLSLTLLVALWTLLPKILKGWQSLQELFPRLSEVQRERARSRRWFTHHILNELQRLDNLESWQDFRFAELEAEVEAEGSGPGGFASLFKSGARPGLRREKSLTRALQRSHDRLVLVEGEPGAGKSVALRHVARTLGLRAASKRDPNIVVPLYINLKEFDVPPEEVGHKRVHQFVLDYINRVKHRDVEEFLEEEFELGLKHGSWFFLFDSFDEIPAVLSAIEPNKTVQRIAEALNDFMGGMNRCRCIIATRSFRAPATLSWPHFRILRLSERRQRQLIRGASLPISLRKQVIATLPTASSDVLAMSSNPMFLGLLCEYVKSKGEFPQHSHSVFESYFSRRFSRDTERVMKRFGLTPTQLMETAERVAFAMTASSSIGLSPTRDQLSQALESQGLAQPADYIEHLDALEYLKLARSETESAHGGSRPFTFAHRRFQEYFATLYVTRDVNRVPAEVMLSDGRWRESAVVILQTLPPATVEGLVTAAIERLRRGLNDSDRPTASFAAELHILGIFQDGFSGRANELPAQLRLLAGEVVEAVMSRNRLMDEKRAVEYAGVAPTDLQERLVQQSFDSGSQWLQETAFQQLGRLTRVSAALHTKVAALLGSLFYSGRLRAERYSVEAQLARMVDHADLMSLFRFLRIAPYLDKLIHIALFAFYCAEVALLGRGGHLLIYDSFAVFACGVTLAISAVTLQVGWLEANASFMRFVAGFSIAMLAVGVRLPWLALGGFLALFFIPLMVSGALTHPHWTRTPAWIILPVLAVVNWLRDIPWRGVIAVAVCMVGVAFLVTEVERLPLQIRHYCELFGLFFRFCFFSALGSVTLVCLIWLGGGGFAILRRQSILAATRSPVDAEGLASLLKRCMTRRCRAWLTGRLRARNLVIIDSTLEAYLARVSSTLDAVAAGDDSYEPPELMNWDRPIDAAFNRFRLKRLREANLLCQKSDRGLLEFRDEICRLYELVLARSVLVSRV